MFAQRVAVGLKTNGRAHKPKSGGSCPIDKVPFELAEIIPRPGYAAASVDKGGAEASERICVSDVPVNATSCRRWRMS